MLHLTPFRYLLSCFLNITLHDKPIRKSLPGIPSVQALIYVAECTNKEYVTFDPPPGQTCSRYMQVRCSAVSPPQSRLTSLSYRHSSHLGTRDTWNPSQKMPHRIVDIASTPTRLSTCRRLRWNGSTDIVTSVSSVPT
jgi:hypothetical protein